MKSKLLGILSLLVLVLALAACDGSSGSSSSNGSSSSSSAKSAVAAAPMQLAKVFGLSIEGKHVLIGTTNDRGAFTANSNTSKMQFPAVVWSVGGCNVNDDPTDPNKEFKGTLKGVMESADSAVYLTPANSLVAAFFEKSGNLTDAKQQVISLLKYEMGLKSSDPLGDPLVDLNQSEIVAKSLMHFIGAADENDGDTMELLSAKFTAIAEEMSNGQTFTQVLRAMPTSPFFNHNETLCNCVTAHADAIAKEAKDSLGDLGDLTELEKIAVPIDTSGYPIALIFDDLSSTEKRAGTQDTDVDIKFLAKVKKANGENQPSETLYVSYLDNGTLKGETQGEMEEGETYTPVLPSELLTFTVSIPEDATFPYEASFTLETIEENPAFPTFSRNYTVTFIGEDEFAVKEVAYSGEKLFAFNDSTVDGKIAEAAISTDAFTANVTLVNPIDESFAGGNMDVRFIAPLGFAFNNPSGNEDAIIIESFTKDGSVYTTTPATYDLTAKVNVKAGFKTFGIQVLDQDGNLIAQTTKDIVFVPEDQKDDLTGVTLTAQTLTTAVPEDGKFAPVSIDLAGTYKTWVKEADPKATTGGITALPEGCEVILMSKTGAKVFGDAASPVDRITIPVTLSEKFEFTSEVTNFVYNYNNANDDIKMVFMLDPEDTNDNLESPTLLKLRFEAP